MEEAVAQQLQDQPSAGLVELLERCEEISTLPQVALRVMHVASDPESGAADLRQVVESDPALSARVLRMVNSAAFGLSATCGSLHQAISYLGFNQIRNLAITASVSETFKLEQKIGSYERQTLWRHLVAVGICARMVGMRSGLANYEDGFLCGLLHDVGIILMDQLVHPQFRQFHQQIDPHRDLTEQEHEFFGFDHAQLGCEMARSWGFAEATRAAIRWHHASQEYQGPGAEIVRCVEVANIICTIKGITSCGQKLVKPNSAAFQALGLEKEDILVLAEDLDAEIVQSERLFEL